MALNWDNIEIISDESEPITVTAEERMIIVSGQPGQNGKNGKAATVKIGKTTTLPAGSQATVVNRGTETDAVLEFGIPRGSSGGSGGGAAAWGEIEGSLSNQTDLADALSRKADASSLGSLASKDSVDYETEVTNKPTLGTMSAVDDAPSNGNEYVRKNGAWAVASGGGSVSAAWGQITGALSDQTDLANALSAKANSADVYTKTQADNLLADKANASNVYSKTETDNLLAGKLSSVAWGDIGGTLANQADLQSALTSKADASSVYTKTEADALLNAKANTADLGNLASQNTVDYATDVTNKPTLGGIQVRPDYEIVDSTNEPTDGVTSLATGKIIFVYEA